MCSMLNDSLSVEFNADPTIKVRSIAPQTVCDAAAVAAIRLESLQRASPGVQIAPSSNFCWAGCTGLALPW